MTNSTTDLAALLADLKSTTATVIGAVPTVDTVGDDFSADQIPSSEATRWVKINDVVAVVSDMKSSTHLGTGRHDTSTARIYKAAVEGAVRIYHDFGADFIDIQGDGGFGLFWGDLAYERALCAAVTIRTFSETMTEQLNAKWSALPETGFKVGIHSGRVVVKSLGTRRNPSESEAVWAGKPVNYAAKCAQSANAHQVVITQNVWERYSRNDYVAFSCGCGGDGPTARLWSDTTVPTLPEKEQAAVVLSSAWCQTCGPDFCAAILAGSTSRADVPTEVRRSLSGLNMAKALEAKRAREVSSARARKGTW